jgi:uncharacterized protein YecT (DUF1311 family)
MDSWRAKLILSLSLLLLPFTVAFAQTQSEMGKDACDEFKKADNELNKLYQRILSEYKADALFVQKMRSAQRAWVAYRDAHLEALYPATNPQFEYGSVFLMCHCTAMAEITRKRAEELRRWVDGVDEAEACAGSIRIRMQQLGEGRASTSLDAKSVPTPLDLTSASDIELQKHLGETVTMRGPFSLNGKVGPFIVVRDRPIYFVSHGSFSWGERYARLEGREVRVTGTLRFAKYPKPSPQDLPEGRPGDHFYFEAETAKVELSER